MSAAARLARTTGEDEPTAGEALATSAGALLASTPLPTRSEIEPSATEALAVAAGSRLASEKRPGGEEDSRPNHARPKARTGKPRRVRRVVRHVELGSVLKISLLFFTCVFLILCVASALLWSTARSAGVVDDVESFITSLGYGNCEDAEGDRATDSTTTTTLPEDTTPPDQVNPIPEPDATGDEPPSDTSVPDDDGNCPEGKVLVGGFKFEDGRIFQAFALGGVVLVLAGAAGSVVLAMLFNLISDVTGGLRLTVIEEDPPRRRPAGAGSPKARRRG